jgi:hypothetical protein
MEGGVNREIPEILEHGKFWQLQSSAMIEPAQNTRNGVCPQTTQMDTDTEREFFVLRLSAQSAGKRTQDLSAEWAWRLGNAETRLTAEIVIPLQRLPDESL